jgi:hypothetical protein
MLLVSLVGATPAQATPSPDLVGTKATLACLQNGGANITFWVRNIGEETIRIEDEVVLKLTIARTTGPEQGPVAYMLPIPELATIRPRGVSRFKVPMGDGAPGNSGLDLSGLRVRLRIDVYLVGHQRPVVGRFRFPSCPPPAGSPSPSPLRWR